MTASREIATTEQLSTRRELELLRDLQRLANERAREEERIRTVLAEGLQAAEQARDAAAAEIEREFNEGRTAATSEYESVTGEARQRYEEDRNAAQKEYKGLRHGVESELSRVKEAAATRSSRRVGKRSRCSMRLKGQPRERFLATVQRLERNNQELAVLEHDAIEIMQMRRQWREFPAVEASSDGEQLASGQRFAGERPAKRSDDAVEQAIQRATDLTIGCPRCGRRTASPKVAAVVRRRNAVRRFLRYCGSLPRCRARSSMGPTNWLWIAVSFGIAIVATAGCWRGFGRLHAAKAAGSFRRFSSCWPMRRQGLRVALEAARERGQREAAGAGDESRRANQSPSRSACMRWSASARVGAKARSAAPGRRFRSGWPNCGASWTARLPRPRRSTRKRSPW